MLIALLFALLPMQEPGTAPRFEEAEVVRLEACVYGTGAVESCGDFREEAATMEACAARATLEGGAEGFLNDWRKCEEENPCFYMKPQPGQTGLMLRHCSARSVAVAKIISARWAPGVEASLSEPEWQMLNDVRKRAFDQLELPAESNDPMRASAWQTATWNSWLKWLRIAQLGGKTGGL
jgi:hypothetical protein